MPTLVTGAAGFIGFHLCKRLICNGEKVIGIDNLNTYYDVNLKKERLKELKKISKNKSFIFKKLDLKNKKDLVKVFEEFKPKEVINMAAQAGVRYSIINPDAYISSNIVGFVNLLECSKDYKVNHLVYASSSSVYGGNTNIPFSENDNVDHPVSLYAATKKANELMAHSYSHINDLPSTALRFFTVYGPWGRPDMAYFIYTKSIIEQRPIKIFNNGDMQRDFTYIDDVVEATLRLLKKPPVKNINFNKNSPEPSKSWAPHQIFNIGNSNTILLKDFIKSIEDELNMKALKEYLPMQLGDVKKTLADTNSLEKWINFKPKTNLKDGINKFILWYKNFYRIY